ncbi:hypothetical protein L7F22_053027 [Adiantum nelumboides]|nr:hypothetical protein [Adiantum nelumboides]
MLRYTLSYTLRACPHIGPGQHVLHNRSLSLCCLFLSLPFGDTAVQPLYDAYVWIWFTSINGAGRDHHLCCSRLRPPQRSTCPGYAKERMPPSTSSDLFDKVLAVGFVRRSPPIPGRVVRGIVLDERLHTWDKSDEPVSFSSSFGGSISGRDG